MQLALKKITLANLALCVMFVYLSMSIGCGEKPKECYVHVESQITEVQISSSGIQIDGFDLALPCTPDAATEVLGEPSRVREPSGVHELENRIYTWDDKGMRAYVDPKSNLLHCIGFALGPQDYSFWPQKDYGGVLLIRSVKLCTGSNTDDLRRTGFAHNPDLPLLFQLRMEPLLITAESDLEVRRVFSIEIGLGDRTWRFEDVRH